MKIYKLIGTGVNGGPDWDFDAVYKTRERAERQKESEIRAYTMVDGVKLFDCPYDFEVVEVEVI
jgi:hypothetical protein